MPTAGDLIATALNLIGVIRPGQTPSTVESTRALNTLNTMLQSWSIQQLAIYSVQEQKFALTAGQGSYTWGTGGNFNVARPSKVTEVTISRGTGANEIRRKAELVNRQQWSEIPDKGTSSLVPRVVYVDYAYPLANVYLHPIPANPPASLVAGWWTDLQQFVATTDVFTLPEGYQIAIEYNLAVNLARLYPASIIEPDLVALAKEYKDAVGALNHSNQTAELEVPTPARVLPTSSMPNVPLPPAAPQK